MDSDDLADYLQAVDAVHRAIYWSQLAALDPMLTSSP
jgi:hypothetical protein